MSFKGARKRNLRWNTFLVTMLLLCNPDIFMYCNWHRFTTKPIPPHAIFGYKLCLLKFKQVHLYWLVLRMHFSPCILSMNKTFDYLCNLVMDCNFWCNFKMTIPVGQFSGWRFPILVKYIDNKSQVIKWWELKFTLLNYWWWDKRCLRMLSSWTLMLISNKSIDIPYDVIFNAKNVLQTRMQRISVINSFYLMGGN